MSVFVKNDTVGIRITSVVSKAAAVSCGDADHAQEDHGGRCVVYADAAVSFCYEPRHEVNVIRRIGGIPVVGVKISYVICDRSDLVAVAQLTRSVQAFHVPVRELLAHGQCVSCSLGNCKACAVNIFFEILIRVDVAGLVRYRRRCVEFLIGIGCAVETCQSILCNRCLIHVSVDGRDVGI